MKGPCEHCHNPDKSLFLSECRYKGGFPSRRAFVLSTSDPPCVGDAYDEGQRELASEKRQRLFWTLAMLALLALLLFSAFARASDCPPPIAPEQVDCEQAKQHVARVGINQSVRMAVRCGFSLRYIREVRLRCKV